ncbi:Predicted transposase YbfD/YdcC associated with H repeats [Ferrimonas sediminum]|uniref:Predicted transposase YbfD/YdcC associated with H repeats n=1 Tax=Ferrimonas sediminum TaxID=718193 RepID=A0A1G8SYZ5_9GAMM|nr:ISAs1 family transposase [Ferrimonas sediminum]SDJ34394.1 Predicted transposase YbfD/YdcC associated with H repeats [Ferrimonas sediminum]
MHIDSFSQHFAVIQDPRQSAKITYPLFDVLFLTVCATIAGMDGWEDIEDFGEAHLDWLQSKGLFREGLPVHDTIARVVSSVEPSQFQDCFLKWMQAVSASSEGELIAIDGKVLRGSYNREDRKSTIHMVSAFATANGVVMGQVKTQEKSNEITAIPELLKLLDVSGCLVSIDAMGCQTDIASQIVKQGGDYLLAVKGNQENLAKVVQKALAPVSQKNHTSTIGQGHGRVEAHEYHVLPATDIAAELPVWEGLKTIGVAIGYRLDSTGKESLDYRYYISSAELTPERFADAVRGHWEIESRLHWVLDVTMNEDACQIYRGNAAEVLAGVRHMALNMLRLETGKKASIRRKQKMAAMNSAYLEQVILAGINRLGKN